MCVEWFCSPVSFTIVPRTRGVCVSDGGLNTLIASLACSLLEEELLSTYTLTMNLVSGDTMVQ